MVSSYNETDSSAKFSTSNATSSASRAPNTAWSANSTTAASDPGETGGQDPAAGNSGDPEGASAIQNVKASQDHDANRDSASTFSADPDESTGTMSVTKTRHRSHSTEATPAQDTSTADLDSHDSADTSHGGSDSSSDHHSDGANADSDDGNDRDDGDDGDDGVADQSTMTSLFASSSHMRKGQGTKTASPSDSSMDHASSTGTLAPTIALPSKHERVAQTPAASAPATPSATSSSIPSSQPTGVLDGKGGVKLANSAGRRLCAPEAPVWICGLLVAAFVL
ncbi:uncharacterized protein LAESUDRAFT_515 [Laetiporus sulphureus 93-53]|uniref:Uncharacterized protein n=1 Tax=Laetiporus sulphureus 93-53 TaxID=1314785 RepID=A0A165I1D0_9APHY|nr:uncharacterized protein LAESUDRAFT_515 [Laetiporus sulphureus 93-53]KZT12463.1 hypothetical protein LAESUDRAFT_515 [Laetiporus sulphureus 93-53]